MRRLLPVLAALAAAPAGAEEGAAVFEARCASCHSVAAGAPSGAGPSLAGLIGREVAGDPGYDYSPVLREARQRGDVWDRARLVRFLRDTEEMYPGLWMGGAGLRGEGEIEAVAAYLAQSR
ncbi:c-type cytochrome [Elioraea rosea]|uniref:c-type cytochrome n=1 Tax=Elioraea rosea TaxID=2492390 RepID=UPI0011820F97|nr:c-type cytochrome [Elioraea rosea]